jgi:hypothetical protein
MAGIWRRLIGLRFPAKLNKKLSSESQQAQKSVQLQKTPSFSSFSGEDLRWNLRKSAECPEVQWRWVTVYLASPRLRAMSLGHRFLAESTEW